VRDNGTCAIIRQKRLEPRLAESKSSFRLRFLDRVIPAIGEHGWSFCMVGLGEEGIYA